MLKNSIALKITLLCSFILVFAINSVGGRGLSHAQTPTVDCSTITDQQIFDEIKKALQAAFKKPSARAIIFKDLNITVTNKVVKLQGAIGKPGDYIKILNTIKSIDPKFRKCIKAIDVNKYEQGNPGHCDPVTETTCPNGRCVDKGDSCTEIG